VVNLQNVTFVVGALLVGIGLLIAAVGEWRR
jgi:hypothetical protein